MDAPAGRRHGCDSRQRRRDYPAAVRAVVFVNPTTVASWHRKRWKTLEKTTLARTSAPMTTRFPVFGALLEREQRSAGTLSAIHYRLAQFQTERNGPQRIGLRAWIAALDTSPADLRAGLRQIQVSGDTQESMGASGVAIADRTTRSRGPPREQGTS
jgi:hypothetical protein